MKLKVPNFNNNIVFFVMGFESLIGMKYDGEITRGSHCLLVQYLIINKENKKMIWHIEVSHYSKHVLLGCTKYSYGLNT